MPKSDWIFQSDGTIKCPHCETVHSDDIAKRYCPMCGAFMHDERWNKVWEVFKAREGKHDRAGL